jgi:hypothetical protein
MKNDDFLTVIPIDYVSEHHTLTVSDQDMLSSVQTRTIYGRMIYISLLGCITAWVLEKREWIIDKDPIQESLCLLPNNKRGI